MRAVSHQITICSFTTRKHRPFCRWYRNLPLSPNDGLTWPPHKSFPLSSHVLISSPTMAHASTFCALPVSTSFDRTLPKSLLSLDWILTNGISVRNSAASGVVSLPYGDGRCSLEMHLSPAPSLSYDLVLGRDWLLLCRDAHLDRPFALTSGVVNIYQSLPGYCPHSPLLCIPHGFFQCLRRLPHRLPTLI
jgi:hypothetical protein